MTAITTKVAGRHIHVSAPEDWPDGTEVEIHPLKIGDDGALRPEEIAKALQAMDELEPLELSDKERVAWETQRQARKDWEKSEFGKHATSLQRMWESVGSCLTAGLPATI